jgi:hypothetical protein
MALCPQRPPAFIKVRRRSCLSTRLQSNAEICFENMCDIAFGFDISFFSVKVVVLLMRTKTKK